MNGKALLLTALLSTTALSTARADQIILADQRPPIARTPADTDSDWRHQRLVDLMAAPAVITGGIIATHQSISHPVTVTVSTGSTGGPVSTQAVGSEALYVSATGTGNGWTVNNPASLSQAAITQTTPIGTQPKLIIVEGSVPSTGISLLSGQVLAGGGSATVPVDFTIFGHTNFAPGGAAGTLTGNTVSSLATAPGHNLVSGLSIVNAGSGAALTVNGPAGSTVQNVVVASAGPTAFLSQNVNGLTINGLMSTTGTIVLDPSATVASGITGNLDIQGGQATIAGSSLGLLTVEQGAVATFSTTATTGDVNVINASLTASNLPIGGSLIVTGALSQVSINGGSIAGALAVNAATVSLTGFPIGGAVTANGGSLSLIGGSVGGAVNANNATLTLANLPVSGDVTTSGSIVTLNSAAITGNYFSTTDTTQINGGSISGVVTETGSTITASNLQISGAVTAVNGSVSLSGGSVSNTVDATNATLKLANLPVSGDVTTSRSMVTLNSAAITGNYFSTADTTQINGGSISGNVTETGSTLTANNLQVTGGLTAMNGSISVSGGNIGSLVDLQNATLTATNLQIGGLLNVNGGSVTITGGAITNPGGGPTATVTANNATVALTNLTIAGSVQAAGGSVGISGGSVAGDVTTTNSVVALTNVPIAGGVTTSGGTDTFNGAAVTGSLSTTNDTATLTNTTIGGSITATNDIFSMSSGSFGKTVTINGGTALLSTVTGGTAGTGSAGNGAITGNNAVMNLTNVATIGDETWNTSTGHLTGGSSGLVLVDAGSNVTAGTVNVVITDYNYDAAGVWLNHGSTLTATNITVTDNSTQSRASVGFENSGAAVYNSSNLTVTGTLTANNIDAGLVTAGGNAAYPAVNNVSIGKLVATGDLNPIVLAINDNLTIGSITATAINPTGTNPINSPGAAILIGGGTSTVSIGTGNIIAPVALVDHATSANSGDVPVAFTGTLSIAANATTPATKQNFTGADTGTTTFTGTITP